MTNAFSRLLAFPFAIILIIAFSMGGFDFSGPKTIVVMICLIALMLIYVFNRQLDIWWWKRNPPALDLPLKTWMAAHSRYYQELDDQTRDKFEKRLATFVNVKNFTLKAERDYQLEEDVKAILAHEYVRLTLHRDDYLFKDIEQFVLYNHPFGTPDKQYLHTIEVNIDEGVVILSKEQLVNGFLQPTGFVNVGILSAVMAFIKMNPRLNYPEVSSLDAQDIADAHGINLSVIYTALGEARMNNLDLLIFCYLLHPNRTESFDPDRYKALKEIFDLEDSTIYI